MQSDVIVHDFNLDFQVQALQISNFDCNYFITAGIRSVIMESVLKSTRDLKRSNYSKIYRCPLPSFYGPTWYTLRAWDQYVLRESLRPRYVLREFETQTRVRSQRLRPKYVPRDGSRPRYVLRYSDTYFSAQSLRLRYACQREPETQVFG